MRGEFTCFPLGYYAKRQGCVSTSSTEAELVAGDSVLKRLGLPALQLWDAFTPNGKVLTFHEDNQAMIAVLNSGRNPTMRHLGRVHRVCIAWLHEQFAFQKINLIYEPSKSMAAEIFTKAITNKEA